MECEVVTILESIAWIVFWAIFCDHLFLDGAFTEAILSRIRKD